MNHQPTPGLNKYGKMVHDFLDYINAHDSETKEMMDFPHGQSMSINFTCFGQKGEALIDIGCEVQLVHLDFLIDVVRNSRVDPKLLHYSRWRGGEIGSAAGTPIHPLGEVTLPINVRQ